MSAGTAPGRCERCAQLHHMFQTLPGIHGDRPAPAVLPCVHIALERVLATGQPERAEYTTALGGFAGGHDGEVELRLSIDDYPTVGGPWPTRRRVGLYTPDGRHLATSIYDQPIPVSDPDQARAILADVRGRRRQWVQSYGRRAFESNTTPDLHHLWTETAP